ncbi:hypothetical protein G6F31_015482 [Rhizopus arrhizus]|nr:hypothetical protein G6F31_015482 [Rhizopus arrhizus]
MCKRLDAAQRQTQGAPVRVTVNGAELQCRQGDSVAAALFAGGVSACRDTAVNEVPRGPYCMMGVHEDRAPAGRAQGAGMIDTTQCDLLVVGAGPAGLAAATLAAGLGVDTVLLDEQPAPGGQIYRAITTTPVTDRSILGEDYWHGASLVAPFQQSGARYVPGATVWAVAEHTAPHPEKGFEVAYSVAGEARIVHARRLLLATGAQERPFPIPGWTLPGVITAGAAQILLKSAGVVPADRTVLAGSGPLLYLVAWQYLNAGVKIDALLETTPPGRMGQALSRVWGFLRSPYLGRDVAGSAGRRQAA